MDAAERSTPAAMPVVGDGMGRPLEEACKDEKWCEDIARFIL